MSSPRPRRNIRATAWSATRWGACSSYSASTAMLLRNSKRRLAVDPEDLEAHYNLMLCYRGLNNDDLATREESLYMRFKADESSLAITGPYKLTHPDDNNETQPVHEHVSVALGQSGGRKRYAEGGRQKTESSRQLAKSSTTRAEGRSQKSGATVRENSLRVVQGRSAGL